MPDIKRIKRCLFWIAIIVLLSTFNVSAQENWNLVKEEAGIKIYTKTESGSKYKAFKAEMQVSCKIENIIEVLKNMNSVNNWVVNCKGV